MTDTTKRDDILQATLKLIVQHDLDHTSMDMIAKEAKVGMGTIYNYFPSKEELVNQLYLESKRKLGGTILQDYSPEAPLREQFFHLWRNFFHFHLRHPDIFQFLEQYSFSPIITPETKASVGWRFWEISHRIMENGRQQQILKDLPPDILLLIATSPINNLVKGHLDGQINLDERRVEAAITACWDAIKL
jgi:AcrR family transcriptional regulator